MWRGKVQENPFGNARIKRKSEIMTATPSLNALFMSIPKLVFSLLGFDILSETSRTDRRWLTIGFMSSLTIFHIPMGLGVYMNRKDVSLLTDALTSMPTSLITMFKYLFFIYCRRDLVRLIHHMRRLLTEESRASAVHERIILEANRNDQFRSKIYTYCYLSAVVFVGVKTLLLMLTTYLQEGELSYFLPFVAVYPWNTEQVPWYIFTFVWNVVCSFTAVAMNTSFDVLIFAFMNNICALFQIAQHKMRTFVRPASGAEQQQQQRRRFIEIVRFHEECLRIAARISQLVQWVVFVQFFINSVQLCMVGVQVSYTFMQPDCAYFFIFESSLMMELFMFSKCGEELKTESFKCAEALYDSDWHALSPSTRRLLIVVMQRAQTPCSLSGFIVEANMETFKAIVQTSMSYIMMLHKLG